MPEPKSSRLVLDVTDEQKAAWELALESYQETQPVYTSGQRVLGKLVRDFCRSQGVRYPAAVRRRVGRPGKRKAGSAAA